MIIASGFNFFFFDTSLFIPVFFISCRGYVEWSNVPIGLTTLRMVYYVHGHADVHKMCRKESAFPEVRTTGLMNLVHRPVFYVTRKHNFRKLSLFPFSC